MIRRSRLLWGGALIGLMALALLTPTGESDEGLAVQRYLANMGYQVAQGDELPPTDGTLIRLHSVGDLEQAGTLLSWVEAGGNLVLADPGSPLVAELGASAAAPIGFVGTAEVAPGCLAPSAAGVRRVAVAAADRVLEANDDAFVACFATGEGAFLLTRRHGDGTVTILGGSSPLSNALLGEADNALLAVQLAGPSRQVVFGGPTSALAPAAGGVWDALPQRARAALLGVVAAAVAFALVRARRLGKPVLEEPLAPIPASELIRAAARMYRRARAAAYCGGVLRSAMTQRLTRRMGGEATELPRMLARTSGMARERVETILAGPDPRGDEDLIILGRDLEELATRARLKSR